MTLLFKRLLLELILKLIEEVLNLMNFDFDSHLEFNLAVFNVILHFASQFGLMSSYEKVQLIKGFFLNLN